MNTKNLQLAILMLTLSLSAFGQNMNPYEIFGTVVDTTYTPYFTPAKPKTENLVFLYNTDTTAEVQTLAFDFVNGEIKLYNAGNELFQTLSFEKGEVAFISTDPHWYNYPSSSPYAYCGNNPIMRIDPTGMDWYKSEEGNITWTDHTSQKAMDDNGINGTYLGQAHVVFNGSRQEQLGTKNGQSGYINGEGAVTASVTLYGPKGADDIHNFTGFTMTSNADKYGFIDEGLYTGFYYKEGKKPPLSSHWLLKDPVREHDGNINPNVPKQVNADGGYKTEIFIHSTNNNGYAGGRVSIGCLLISPTDWGNFNNVMEGVNRFSVQVNRTDTYMMPLQGVTGTVPGISVPNIVRRR